MTISGVGGIQGSQIAGLAWIFLLILSSVLRIFCFRGLYAEDSFHLARVVTKRLVNIIVERRISIPKRVAKLFEDLPPGREIKLPTGWG